VERNGVPYKVLNGGSNTESNGESNVGRNGESNGGQNGVPNVELNAESNAGDLYVEDLYRSYASQTRGC
jgi:hypothetical protein